MSTQGERLRHIAALCEANQKGAVQEAGNRVSIKLPSHHRPDEQWSELAASLAVDELIAGKLITSDQADFARRIVAQQLHILLISNCRPVNDEISN
jgi:hypothetical protein